MTPDHDPDAPTDETAGRYVTLDVDVSGDLEARWVYDCERRTVGLLLNHTR